MKAQGKRSLLLLLATIATGLAAALVLRQPSLSTEPPIPVADLSRFSESDAKRLTSAREQLTSEPQSANAWGSYGLLLNAFELYDPALVCFRRAAELDASNPRWPYFAHRLLIANDPAAALEHLRRAVHLCGNTPEAPRCRLAQMLAEAGEWPEAEAHASKLLEAHPGFDPARLILAQAALAKGDLSMAGTLARECLDDARTTKAASALLATILARQQDHSSAAEAARRAAAAPPDAVLFDPFEAELDALRNDLPTLAAEAHSLLAARQLSQAQAIADRLLATHPGAAESWLVLGRLRLLQTNYAPAEQALRKHLEIETNSVQGWFQLGSVQLSTQRFREAAQSFHTTTKLKPDLGPGWFNHGVALARSGRLSEAAASLRQAIRYNPERLDTYFLLADLELQARHKDEALRLLSQAEKIAPNDRRLTLLRRKAEQL